MRFRLSSFVLIALSVACSEREPAGAPTPSRDASTATRTDATIADAATATTSDAGPLADVGPAIEDATPADTGPAIEDASAPADAGPAPEDAGPALEDAAPDATTPLDASAPYDGGARCDFLDLEIAIVRCGNRTSYLRNFQDVSGTAGCLPYWTLEGGTFTSSTAAIAGANCSDQCYYRASLSVSFIDHCGRRNGYIVFSDPDPVACPDLYEFSTGLYPSREAWERDTACPDAGP